MTNRLLEVMKNTSGIRNEKTLYVESMIVKVDDYDWLIGQVTELESLKGEYKQAHATANS